MTSLNLSALEQILRLARTATVDQNGSSDVSDHSEAAEANDNEDMLRTGVHMNAAGHASYGSVHLGHVRPHRSGDGYVGVHPTGVLTSKQPTRAKAALSLLNLHQFMPKDSKAVVKHVMLTHEYDVESPLATIIRLGGNAPGNGQKPYGEVEYADPGYQADKKKRYPLDTEEHVRAALGYINTSKDSGKYSPEDLAKVKNKIEAAARKLGIVVSGDSSK